MHLGSLPELRPKSLKDLLYQSRLRPQNGGHNQCNWMHSLQKMPFCKAPRTNSNNLGSKAVWEQDHILATDKLHLKQFQTFANRRFDEATRSLCDAIDGRFGIYYNTTSTMITAMRRDENQKDEGSAASAASMELSEELRAAKKLRPRCRDLNTALLKLKGKIVDMLYINQYGMYCFTCLYGANSGSFV